MSGGTALPRSCETPGCEQDALVSPQRQSTCLRNPPGAEGFTRPRAESLTSGCLWELLLAKGFVPGLSRGVQSLLSPSSCVTHKHGAVAGVSGVPRGSLGLGGPGHRWVQTPLLPMTLCPTSRWSKQSPRVTEWSQTWVLRWIPRWGGPSLDPRGGFQPRCSVSAAAVVGITRLLHVRTPPRPLCSLPRRAWVSPYPPPRDTG